MPTTELDEAEAKDGLTIVQLLVRTKLCTSNGEARRLVEQGGASVNEEKILDFSKLFTVDDLKAGLKIKKGKKVFHKVIVK